ncbi:MAG TPA: TIGR00282 family metallophosphoesterase [Smithellaceae bacterium]|jgi:2',3'-cyclic-nucleotide 2'-phosphodiesterase|nr:TIGR00282 family metallophosphoesterase [Smithellaceae bacterium]HPL67976.1 TIGR00282 family metallophosphoesterase [Smithellaceae bacterium]
MKILFIGDIVGKPGRRAVKELLPSLVSGHDVDMVIANCENAASGFGITREVVEELYDSHIDVLTSGNHVWDKKEVMEFIDDYESLIRPANYPAGVPGAGSVLMPTASGQYVGVLNLAGRIFMHPVDCPFTVAKKEIERLKSRTSVIIVDIHAEATSEKRALGWYLDGEVSAVLGTHTHVQTADNEVLPNGTAYISDAGMTGPFDSVIGIKKDTIIERFLTQIPNRFDVAKNDVRLQGVVIDIDTQSGRANAIERISVKLNQ